MSKQHAKVEEYEPTRRGGVRRTGVAQIESAAQMKRRSAGRILPPVQIKFAEKLGLPDCPYVIRWRVETPFGSVRLHHWLSHDDDRAPHDHPWNFTTFVLKGGYRDVSPEGNEYLHAPTVRHRSATHQHTVFPDEGGCWTVIVTGPKIRTWGFWIAGKFVKMNKYFMKFGHHPCD